MTKSFDETNTTPRLRVEICLFHS